MKINVQDENNKFHDNILLFGFSFFFVYVFLRTAWITDDAAITFRTVLNFVNGFGPNFNIDERVQGFTHPLWFLFLSAGTYLTNDVFSVALLLSLLFSIMALCIIYKLVIHSMTKIILVFPLIFLSKAFIDFSSSGLENPLSHVLLALFILILTNKKINFQSLIFINSLLYLTRPDLILITTPAIVMLLLSSQHLNKNLLKILSFSFLAIFWTMFSMWYYGFPFPNTAYAKLTNGIPFYSRLFQGLKYIIDIFLKDPLTFFVIATPLVFFTKLNRELKWIAVGVFLYVFYIASIGGDFMQGRLFTPPYIASLMILTQIKLTIEVETKFAIGFILLGLVNLNSTILSNENYFNRDMSRFKIMDERGFYYKESGLLSNEADIYKPILWENKEDKYVEVRCGQLGFNGVSKGPSVHFIDDCGLTDPLLSRLKPIPDPNWRIGHLLRALPVGYYESISQNRNLIQDVEIRDLYDKIRTITRGDLYDLDRMLVIIKMNVGNF